MKSIVIVLGGLAAICTIADFITTRRGPRGRITASRRILARKDGIEVTEKIDITLK